MRNNMILSTYVKRLMSLFSFLLLIALVGCSGGSGESTETSEATNETADDTPFEYTGENEPESDFVLSFQKNVWERLADSDRCGACHDETQTPRFVNKADINFAFREIEAQVDFDNPAESPIVQKVIGHNCWLDQGSVCGDVMTRYLNAWINSEQEEGPGDATETVVALTAPAVKQVGVSLKFPTTLTEFQNTIYPVLREQGGCASCHAEDGSRMRQQPYFASSNVESAYQAAQTKINLNAPNDSRLLVRVRDEGHNCWEEPNGTADSCSYSAGVMRSAINEFLGIIPEPQSIDENLARVASNEVNLVDDGVVASSGGRYETNVIALYEFTFGTGGTAFDRSGVTPTLDLSLVGEYNWLGSWGVRFSGGYAFGNVERSGKLHTRITASEEFSLEAWVIPANVTQDGPARIVSYAGGVDDRNFTLGQTLYDYDFFSRSADVDQATLLSTPDADEVLQATLQHVVVNVSAEGGRQMYVNGELVVSDEEPIGDFDNWENIYALSLAGEVGGLESWNGTIRLLAIHDKLLTQEQILGNFDKGVGQKFFLLFGISHLVDVPEAYIVFEVEVFDDYSYLFSAPTFRSLDANAVIPDGGIQIKGLRLGLNGSEVAIGQAYANVDVTITNNDYGPEGVVLDRVGTVIASEEGQDEDDFFLTFDVIGNNTYARATPDVPPAEDAPLADAQSDFGVKIFGEINATLSAMTGVNESTGSVNGVYQTLVQQLPQVEDVGSFLPAHQSGIMQLAVAYCSALAADTTLRAAKFPGFNFSNAITEDNVGLLTTPLLDALNAHRIDIGAAEQPQLNNQPMIENGPVVEGEDSRGSEQLIADLILEIYNSSAGGGVSAAVEQAVTVGCTATAGSAVMLLH